MIFSISSLLIFHAIWHTIVKASPVNHVEGSAIDTRDFTSINPSILDDYLSSNSSLLATPSEEIGPGYLCEIIPEEDPALGAPSKIDPVAAQLTLLDCAALLVNSGWTSKVETITCPMNYGPIEVTFKTVKMGAPYQLKVAYVVWAMQPIWGLGRKWGWQNVDFRMRTGNVLWGTGTIRGPRVQPNAVTADASRSGRLRKELASDRHDANLSSSQMQFKMMPATNADTNATTGLATNVSSLQDALPGLKVYLRPYQPIVPDSMPAQAVTFDLLRKLTVMAQKPATALLEGFESYDEESDFTFQFAAGRWTGMAKKITNAEAARIVPKFVQEMFRLARGTDEFKGVFGEGRWHGQKFVEVYFFKGKIRPGANTEDIVAVSK